MTNTGQPQVLTQQALGTKTITAGIGSIYAGQADSLETPQLQLAYHNTMVSLLQALAE